jgi:predicted CoA-substrate-specific enzyme activase
MKLFLGIDVGSISTNVVAIDEQGSVIYSSYIRTEGNPIRALQRGLKNAQASIEENGIIPEIAGVGATGSARYLAAAVTGADIVKNEITAHARGASFFVPDVRTILEIGGQDSKIILLENGAAVDFAMNLICSAGTGAFLDAQAYRLKIPIEQFGEIALTSKKPTQLGARCTVFCESDMIHKQQIGHATEDIVAGLCQGLVRNFLAGLAKGKTIMPKIVFQGGVSENIGIKKAFEDALQQEVTIPPYNTVMGAVGSALIARDKNLEHSQFFGFSIADRSIHCTSFNCNGCPNHCEVIEARIDNKVVARWGDRCGRWSSLKPEVKK